VSKKDLTLIPRNEERERKSLNSGNSLALNHNDFKTIEPFDEDDLINPMDNSFTSNITGKRMAYAPVNR